MSKNKHNKITIDSREYFQKSYEDEERFSCELKYLRYFKNKSILIPNVYDYDEKNKTITIERIDGQTKDTLTDKEIKHCMDILFKIISEYGLEKQDIMEINKYVSKVRLNIIWWCTQNHQLLNHEELDSKLLRLKKVCYISLFKDAKPDNWVFQEDRIYTIDFDYVKKSFFLADVAQLLSYVSLNRKIDFWPLVSYFLKKVIPGIKNYHEFYIPFLLASVNSNVASKIHRKDLPSTVEKGFDKQNKLILQELEII